MAAGAAAVGPRAGTRPARARPAGVRPAVRLVPRRRAARLVGSLAALAVFTLVSAVLFHVVLAQGQLQLDRLGQQITDARRDYEQRRLEVSMLASPSRIVAEAERLGLVVPHDPPTYLEVPGAPAARVGTAGTATTLADWRRVKPHLGDQP